MDDKDEWDKPQIETLLVIRDKEREKTKERKGTNRRERRGKRWGRRRQKWRGESMEKSTMVQNRKKNTAKIAICPTVPQACEWVSKQTSERSAAHKQSEQCKRCKQSDERASLHSWLLRTIVWRRRRKSKEERRNWGQNWVEKKSFIHRFYDNLSHWRAPPSLLSSCLLSYSSFSFSSPFSSSFSFFSLSSFHYEQNSVGIIYGKPLWSMKLKKQLPELFDS